MRVKVVDIESRVIMEIIENVMSMSGNSVAIKAGAGTSGITFGDEVELFEAGDSDVVGGISVDEVEDEVSEE